MDNSGINQHKQLAMGKHPNGYKKGGKVKAAPKAKAGPRIMAPMGPMPGPMDDAAGIGAPPMGGPMPMGAPSLPPGQGGQPLKKGGRAKKLPHLARGGAIGGMAHHGCDNY